MQKRSVWVYLSISIIYLIGSVWVISPETALGSDYHSPRTAALGGAGHAGPFATDAIHLNPSATALSPSYGIHFGYQKYRGDGLNAGHDRYGRLYNLSIQDGTSEIFQAGVSFTQTETQRMVHVAGGSTIGEKFAVGLGPKLLFPKTSFKDMKIDAYFSATYLASANLQFALMGDNLLQTPEFKSKQMLREITLGTRYRLHKMVFAFLDPHYTPDLKTNSKWGGHAALEIAAMADLFFRGGAFSNSRIPMTNQYGSGWGTGVGWVAPKISFDYAFSQTNQPYKARFHTFAATTFF